MALVLVLTTAAARVHADEVATNQPPATTAEAPQVTLAREAFRRGSAFAKNKEWAEALVAFEESERLLPHPLTRYDIALCEHALGRYARSYRAFSAVLEPASGDLALPADIEAQARLYRAEAEARLSRVRVSLKQNDLELRVDDLPLIAYRPAANPPVFVVNAERGKAEPPLPPDFELLLDPGLHLFVASRRGGSRTSETRVLGVGSATALSFSVVEEKRAPAAAVPPPTTVHHAVERPEPPSHTPSFVAFGVGAAGFIAGGVFAGLALHQKSELDDDPYCEHKTCPDFAEYRDRQSRMRTFADLSTVGFAVGLLGAAAGTYFWITAGPAGQEAAKPETGRIDAWIGYRSAGVSGTF